MISSNSLLEINLKERMLLNETKHLNVYVSSLKIKNFEQHIIDIFFALNFNRNDDELDENESIKIVNSMNISSKQQFQIMIVKHFDDLWIIFEILRRNRDRKVIAIRVWNFQIKNMKIKISNHNKKNMKSMKFYASSKSKHLSFKFDATNFLEFNEYVKIKKHNEKKKRSLHYQNLKNFSILTRDFVLHLNDTRLNILIFLFFLNIKISIFSITFAMTFEKINAWIN